MIRACILAILLIAASADATGLWLDGSEQIASSSSVVTNSSTSTVFSNSLTAAVGVNGGTDYSNGFYVSQTFASLTWYNSTNTSYSVQFSGAANSGELGWTNTAAYDSGEFIARVTCVESRGPGTIGTVSLRIISEAGAPITSVTSSNNPLGQTITCGYTGANVRGVSLLRSGGLGQTSTLDFNDLYLIGATTSITTNSGSGASGPTFDGRVPLSTNRHTFLNGVRQ